MREHQMRMSTVLKIITVTAVCGSLAYAQSEVQPVNDRPKLLDPSASCFKLRLGFFKIDGGAAHHLIEVHGGDHLLGRCRTT